MGRRGSALGAALVLLALALLVAVIAAGQRSPSGVNGSSRPASTAPASVAPSAPTSPTAAGGSPGSGSSTPAAATSDPVLVGAADVASCANENDEATALLLDAIAGTVFAAGDLAYPSGTPAQFAECYGPTWGRHFERTRPVPGNHEYETDGARGYFTYFADRAGAPGEGWYAYDLGTWRVYGLNSNCWAIGGCGGGSRQETWLRADLAAHPTGCALAYWHHPRFSSGQHGNTPGLAPLWQALQDGGADVVIQGHDHIYERFAPQDASGAADAARGIRSFVVGTGGRSHYRYGTIRDHSEVRNNDAYGLLELTLHPAGYDWRFVPVAGSTFTDAGSGTCH